MNILAIDFGTKRLGLAWTDTTLDVVLPYGLIEKNTLPEKVREVAALLKKEKIDLVVVGFPVSLKNQENKNTERVQKFVFELQKQIRQPVEYADERFSSQAGAAAGAGVSRDEKAAMVILDGYLARKKLSS